MQFKDIIGQDNIKRHLLNAAKLGTPAQAYMFEGEKRSGKKSLANAFAASLVCENIDPKTGESCGVCHGCKMAAGGSHPDIVHVFHEKPNEIRVSEVREQINDNVGLKPYYGRFKIYIVDEAEKMNVAAQNAILKTLEDPPEYVVLILLVTNIAAFLPTVLSRCVKLSLTALPDDIIVSELQKRISLPSYEAKIIATFAQGNLGKAFALGESEEFSKLRSDVFSLLSRLDEKSADSLLDTAEELNKEYAGRLGDIFDLFVIWYRDVLLYKASGKKERLVCQEEHYVISRLAVKLDYMEIKEKINAISDARRNLAQRVGDQRVMEKLLLSLI